MASFLVILVEKVIKKKAALLRAGSAIARHVARGGRASRVLARLLAHEAKLGAGLPGVTRIRKLLEMAQAVTGVAQLIGVVLDWVGDDEQAVEQLDAMLDNAINSEEVLDELATFPHDLVSPEEGKLFLQAVGTPIAEDGAPSQAGSAPRRFVAMVRRSMRGVKFSGRVLKDDNLTKEASTLAGKIKHYHPNEFSDIYARVDSLRFKVDPNKRGFLSRLLRQLGSNSATKRQAAAFVLRVADELPAQSARMIFEKFERIVSATGRTLRRFPDIVIGRVWYECKNWRRWPSFPPDPSKFTFGTLDYWRAVRRKRALQGAEKQFLRTLVAKGPAAVDEFKLVLTKGADGVEKFAPEIRRHFSDLLSRLETRAWLKRHMVSFGTPSEPDDMKRYAATLEQVGAAVGSIIDFR